MRKTTGKIIMSNGRKVAPMLAVLYGSAFIAAFNENIINVALVDIMREFGVGEMTAQWLVTGYMLVTAIIVPVMAFFSRRFTLRQVFFEGCLFLGAGSLIALFAPSFPVLLAARLLQSVGTGIFIPLMMTTILAVVPPTRVGTFISIGGACITLGPALAPAAAGVFVTMFGWRSIFLMPAGVIAILFAAGIVLVRNTSEPMKIRLDVLSVAFSAAGLTLGVYGISRIASAPVPAIGLIAAGVALLALFALRQRRLETPVLDLAPLANPRFSVACLLSVIAMMTTFSMSVLLPLYYGVSLGVNSLISGILLLAPIIVNAGTSLLGGRIMDRVGEWPLLPAGFLIIALGQAATCFFGWTPTIPPVLIGSIFVYAGVGAVFSPSQASGLRRLPREQSPHGVAILSTFIQVSACVGPALFIGVLSAVSDKAQAAGTLHPEANAHGFSVAVGLATAIAAVGALVAFFYARRK